MPEMSREQHREQVLREVAGQRKHIPPDGDWAHVLLLDHPHGRMIFQIPPAFVDTERGQVYLATALRATIVEHGLTRWATVGTAWTAKREFADVVLRDPQRGDAVNDPKREERVIVVLGSSDTPHDVELWTARIFRRPRKPPHLGPWDRGTPAGGLLVEPFVLAMESAAGENDDEQ